MSKEKRFSPSQLLDRNLNCEGCRFSPSARIEDEVCNQAVITSRIETSDFSLVNRKVTEISCELMRSANVLIQSVDAKGKFIFVNPEWKKVLGYSDQDIERICLADVIRSDHLEGCTKILQEVKNGQKIYDVETVFLAKCRKEIIVNGNVCAIFENGKFVSTVGFFTNITERKEFERKFEESKIHNEMMNEKLRVVGSITRHDIRNKLTVIPAYSFLLKKRFGDHPEIIDKIDKTENAVKEVEKILDFAKIYELLGVEKLVETNVSCIINEALSMFSDLPFKVINDCDGLTLMADSFLRQLIYNLVDNTRKYGKKTTKIRMSFANSSSEDLMFIYEDDGVGIALENKDRLFQRGFSTGGSTGLGLYLCKVMLEVYGWRIQENGEAGKGARFVITIPRINKNNFINYKISDFQC